MNAIQKSSALVLITLLGVSACSQKPSSEEIAAQVKIALEQEKAKEAAPSAVLAPATVAAPVAPAPAVASHKAAPVKAQPAPNEAAPKPQPVAEMKPICANCGVVVSVTMVEVAGKGSGLGVVAGGVVGGLVGNQVGDGRGKDLATLAGVVGGAFAGNAIEKNAKKSKRYDIVVKMEDGSERTLSQATEPNLASGQKVKVENDAVVKN